MSSVTFIDKIYKIIDPDGMLQTFITGFSEKDFCNTLDSVYGCGNYKIVDIDLKPRD